MFARHPIVPIVAIALPLAACATANDGYPSLLPRAVENPVAPAAAPSPTPMAADPALDAAITEAVGELADAGAAFDKSADTAEALAEKQRGSAAGSDGWLNAQIALGELDVLRQPSAAIASDLQQRQVQRADAGLPPYPALDRAAADAFARVTADRQRIERISAMLAPAA